ncbi:replication-associated protein [army ant associated cyclovirus 4 P8A-3.2_1]|uniref:Replication-associated protein n=1 Tax=army ant associated cyclovirus 4 P8A-3.2_1 TaxID=3070164 RepID=A0AA47KVN2_9CIRC|nr:replication-associated protein [Army ant associated cyclovirus 4]WBG01478.1 replication-associated protein [Army ant associated cyclovirus 4]
MSNGTVRRFVWTWNNYTEEDIETAKSFLTSKCKYGIFGKEVAPTTGTRHLQGFCNLTKPMRFNAIKKHLHHSIHIEKAAGSDVDNKEYCSKAGDVFETGSPHKQGRRSDLESVVAAVQAGERDQRKLAEINPAVYIRYFRGIRELVKTLNPVHPRDYKTEVFYYYGPPGSGKSKRALQEALRSTDGNSSDIYYKPRGLWWDGYCQQSCVIIDDFYGWIKYDELLKIMDRYPYKVQVKGSFEEFTSKHIWITSNVDIDDLYHFIGYKTDAIERRITCKEYMA